MPRRVAQAGMILALCLICISLQIKYVYLPILIVTNALVCNILHQLD